MWIQLRFVPATGTNRNRNSGPSPIGARTGTDRGALRELDAALGGVAAAWWLGLHPKEPRKHLVFTGSHGAHSRSSATAVVRHRRLTDADVTTHADLRVTAAALTVLDASAELGIAVLDSALLSG